MQTTSNDWKRLLRRGFRVEVKMRVDGVEFPVAVPDSAAPTGVTVCRRTHQLFTEAALIGNACAAMLELTYYPTIQPSTMATIQLFARLVGSGGEVTEWLPQGVYYIDERSRGYFGALSIVAYDALMLAEQDYFAGGVISGTWPAPCTDVVSAVCARLGVALDSRTALNGSIMVETPINMTMRDVLRYIAAAHGGNWTMTPEGKLRLAPLPEVLDRVLLGSETGAIVGDENGNNIVIYSGSDFLSTGVCCKSYDRIGDEISVGRVALIQSDDGVVTAGSSGYQVRADCPFATDAAAALALANLQDRPFVPFEARSCQLDPAVELGDRAVVASDMSVVGSVVVDMGIAYLADIGAPVAGDVEHEIPYQTQTQKEITRKVAQAKSEIKLTTDSITAQVTAVDGRVTQLRLDLDGISAEVQDQAGNLSTLQQTSTSLQSQITAVDGRMSEVEQTVDGITSTVSGFDGRISTVEQTVDGVTITTSTGTTYLNGGSFRTEDIMASKIKLGGQMNVYATLDDTSEAGYMGYVEGRINGNPFSGIGMLASADTAVLGSSVDDVLILSGDDTGIFAGNRIDLHANGHIRVDSGYFRPMADDTTYCGSYSYQWTDGYYQTLHVANSAITTSDRRAKTEIDYDMSKWLHLLDLLKPCTYRRTEGKRTHPGLIAQEVIEAGETAGLDLDHLSAVCQDKESGLYGLRYEEFVPALIAKVQQLEERIKGLEGT